MSMDFMCQKPEVINAEKVADDEIALELFGCRGSGAGAGVGDHSPLEVAFWDKHNLELNSCGQTRITSDMSRP